jgi:hypothetical protein
VWLKGFGRKKRNLTSVGVAAVPWTIWKTRNLACFESKWPNEPIDVLNRVVYWIKLWSDLQVKECTKLELELGARVLERVAAEVFQARRGWATWIPKLMNNDDGG